MSEETNHEESHTMRCCFNQMIPDVVNTLVNDLDRVLFACDECRMIWAISRLQMSMVFTPVGRMPLVEVAKAMPPDLRVIQGKKVH